MEEIQGKVILVTGGASGLGLATVEHLSAKGAKIVLLDLPSSDGMAIASRLGDHVAFTPANVTSEDDVVAALKTLKDKFGQLNIVVNCAGIFPLQTPTYDVQTDTVYPLDLFRRTFEVNVFGTFNVTRLAVQLMSKNKPNEDGQRGLVINVSSVTAKHPIEQIVSYTASKGAIDTMTICLARDLASLGIRSVGIAPGLMDTPVFANVPVKMAAAWFQQMPNPRRLGRPNEFSHLVQAIIKNRYINGTIIKLDAGYKPSFVADKLA